MRKNVRQEGSQFGLTELAMIPKTTFFSSIYFLWVFPFDPGK